MTFPYFESEWDLVGYLLEAIFGDNDENSEYIDDDNSDEDNDDD